MNQQLLTASALLVGSTFLTSTLLAGGDESFWSDLAPTTESGAWATYEARDAKLEAQVWELLRSAASGEVENELVVKQLVDRGPRVVPVLFAVLTGEALESEAGAGSETKQGGVQGRPRGQGGASVEGLVYETLTALPPAVVADHMQRAATGEAPTEIRVLAARVLAQTGGAEALDVMLEVLASMDPLQLQRPFLRGPFGDALEEILRSSPSELRSLGERLEGLHPEVTLLVVGALPTDRVSDGVPVVLGLFGQDEELDLVLMEQLAEFASTPLGAGNSWSTLDWLQIVEGHLRSDDWHMRSRAVVATAKLNNSESLETLVKMLDDEHRSVARTVHWSLREMTGQSFEPDRRRWAAWLAAERAWFRGPHSEVEWRVLSGVDSEIIAGIRELNQHLIFRDSSTDLLGPLLPEASPAVFAAVLGILVRLDSPRAIPFLVDSLESGDEYKRVGAWQALRKLTELNLPQDRTAWREHLGI